MPKLKLEAREQCIPPPRHILPASWYRSGSISGSVIQIITKILSLVHRSIANLPWKFHANPFRSFCTKLLIADRQTTSITHPLWRMLIDYQFTISITKPETTSEFRLSISKLLLHRHSNWWSRASLVDHAVMQSLHHWSTSDATVIWGKGNGSDLAPSKATFPVCAI